MEHLRRHCGAVQGRRKWEPENGLLRVALGWPLGFPVAQVSLPLFYLVRHFWTDLILGYTKSV